MAHGPIDPYSTGSEPNLQLHWLGAICWGNAKGLCRRNTSHDEIDNLFSVLSNVRRQAIFVGEIVVGHQLQSGFLLRPYGNRFCVSIKKRIRAED